jgi:isopenicillin N synthase-like dioxygenase
MRSVRVPVVDLAGVVAGEAGAAEQAARELAAASEGVGAYFLRNHGVPQPLVERAFAQSARFHRLPLERKLEVAVVDDLVGYVPLGGQTPVHGDSGHPDRNAAFFARQEFSADDPDRSAGRPWVFDNRWPRDLPGFRDTVLEYFDAMAILTRRLLALQSLALGLAPGHFLAHEAFRPPSFNLKLLHYPPPDASLAGQVGVSAHTDYGHCTLLAQDGTPGLQLETPSGWLDVPAPKGDFLVNNSEMFRAWTNGRFKCPVHRVVNRSATERLSIAFFVAGRYDVVLECLPSCHGPGNPPRYPATSWGEHFRGIRRTRLGMESTAGD